MSRLDTLMAAARRTSFYGPNFRGLASAMPVTIDDFYRHRERFRDPQAVAAPPEFRYPFSPAPEVTVAVAGFRPRPGIRIVSDIRPEQLRSLEGCALAAPAGVLRELAAAHCGTLDFPPVVFTGPRFGWLSAADRELFWRAFHVPVFEQVLGVSGHVLAGECTAHTGLHVSPSAVVEIVNGQLLVSSLEPAEYVVLRLATGAAARLVDTPCACGCTAVRLADVHCAQQQAFAPV